jgi:hypothetical protein
MQLTKPERIGAPVFDGPSSFPRRAFRCLPSVSLLGVALLVANIALSFEEPHWPMLTVAALLLLAAPLGILIHMAITSEMTPAEKRMWLSALAGRQGPSLFAAYFSGTDRARATQMLVPRVRGMNRQA